MVEKTKVIIVDDDDADVQALRRSLKKSEPIYNLSFNVEEAKTYKEAEEILQSKSFDICLLDYKLDSGMVGVDLAKAINGHEHIIPIIVLTNNQEFLELDCMDKYGIYGFINKDILSPSLLGSSIRYTLSLSKIIKEQKKLIEFMDLIFNSISSHLEAYNAMRKFKKDQNTE